MPLLIAETSTCSCGGTLSLSNHALRQAGDELHFTGVYVCASCEKKKSVMWKKVFTGLKRIWQDIKKVRVGPEGFELERIENVDSQSSD